MMASTIGPIDAGIVGALEDAYRRTTGVDVRHVVIRVNPARFPRVNATEATRFVDWLVSDEAQRLIQGFGVSQYGEPPFFPNAAEWRRRHPTG
jgi:ABC-type tungstate transport system permease subunit